MDEDWETAAEKEVVVRPKVNVNKWDGEDDDEDVKDSWDLEDEEEKKDEEKSEKKVTTPAKAKPSKAMKAKIAEKERLAEEEEERRLAAMSPEEKLAEKLRLQKIQEESDLKSALDTFGVNTNLPINQFNPVTKEEFREFATTLSWCITQHKDSPFYDQLVEDVIRGVCAHMSSADIKKVKICVESLHSEKLKMEKQSKKPVGKGKARATIRTENDDIETYKNYGDDFGGDEYDDFM